MSMITQKTDLSEGGTVPYPTGILEIKNPKTVHAEFCEETETYLRPDISHLPTEDDTPVDNRFSEKQMRLLTRSLYTGWNPGVPFIAMANVGLYFALNARFVIVPDVLVSVGVTEPDNIKLKHNRSYMSWEVGKVPDIVVEIVSNKKGGELDQKLKLYAHHGVRYYAVYDPSQLIQEQPLSCFALEGWDYVKLDHATFPEAKLGLVEWEGEFEGISDRWLRWVDESGKMCLTGKEAVSAEKALVAELEQRAAKEARKAEEQALKAEALAAKLRELGVDPDSVL